MLQLCNRNDFELYADFVYEMAMDLAKSGYPTYCDMIKTKEMFIDRCLKAFERENEEMLLFVYEGEVQGLIHYYWIPEDSYIQTNCFNINTAVEQAISEFLTYVGERFNGYDLFMGFPAENDSAVRWLFDKGFECIENDYDNTAFLDNVDHISEYRDIVQIDKENFDSFRYLHQQIEGDMYWNSERIFCDLDNWVIFVKEKNGEPQGAVYYKAVKDGWFEIFGIDIDQGLYAPALVKELIRAALSDAKLRHGKVMTFFCEEEYEDIAKQCGFYCIGNYLCYKIHLA